MPSDPLGTNFFGPSFTQDIEKFTIWKADLAPPSGLNPAYEFTPTVSNRAESIFLALFLRVQRNQDVSLDSQMVIAPFEQSLEFRFGKWQRVYSCNLTVYIDDPVSTYPNPNLV